VVAIVMTLHPKLEAALAAAALTRGVDRVDLVLGVLRQRFLTDQHAPEPAGRLRTLGLHPGAIVAAPDFDALLPDEFWSGRP
jgi:hypothetical protein